MTEYGGPRTTGILDPPAPKRTVTPDNRPRPAVPPRSPWSHQLIMGAAVVLPFVGLVVAMAMLWQVGWMGWPYVAMVIVGWALTSLGVTVGFHRLLTHRSFETYRWVRAVWMGIGALSVQGSPLVWCAVHRRHHEHSDNPGDPHSPHLHGDGWKNTIRGFLHAHTGWLFTGFWSSPELKRYVPDLLSEKMLRRLDRHYYLLVLLSLALPAAIGACIEADPWKGAWLGLLWGGLVRIWFTHHMTWSINSVCHMFGRREYESGDDSRNNPIFGILAMGEGWHNNHHAFPTSARHGLRWWQLDGSWLVIKAMQGLGLAWNIRLPSEALLEAKRIRAT